MKTAVHLMTDGSVRVNDGYTQYLGTAAEFALDWGESAPSRPTDIDEIIYEPHVRHAYCKTDFGVVDGGPMPWPDADQLIPGTADAVAKQEARRQQEEEAKVTNFRAEEKARHDKFLAEQRQKSEQVFIDPATFRRDWWKQEGG